MGCRAWALGFVRIAESITTWIMAKGGYAIISIRTTSTLQYSLNKPQALQNLGSGAVFTKAPFTPPSTKQVFKIRPPTRSESI